jgi:hypothetical protein
VSAPAEGLESAIQISRLGWRQCSQPECFHLSPLDRRLVCWVKERVRPWLASAGAWASWGTCDIQIGRCFEGTRCDMPQIKPQSRKSLKLENPNSRSRWMAAGPGKHANAFWKLFVFMSRETPLQIVICVDKKWAQTRLRKTAWSASWRLGTKR